MRTLRRPTDLVGEFVGGYRLTTLLGTGMSGAVYVGERIDGSGGAAPRVIKVFSPAVALSDGAYADLRTRFDKWCDSLLRPGSFLAPGRPVPPFDESGAEGDNTAAWRAVFAKNRRDADHRGLTAS